MDLRKIKPLRLIWRGILEAGKYLWEHPEQVANFIALVRELRGKKEKSDD